MKKLLFLLCTTALLSFACHSKSGALVEPVNTYTITNLELGVRDTVKANSCQILHGDVYFDVPHHSYIIYTGASNNSMIITKIK